MAFHLFFQVPQCNFVRSVTENQFLDFQRYVRVVHKRGACVALRSFLRRQLCQRGVTCRHDFQVNLIADALHMAFCLRQSRNRSAISYLHSLKIYPSVVEGRLFYLKFQRFFQVIIPQRITTCRWQLLLPPMEMKFVPPRLLLVSYHCPYQRKINTNQFFKQAALALRRRRR